MKRTLFLVGALLLVLGAQGCRKKAPVAETATPTSASAGVVTPMAAATPAPANGLLLQKVHFELNRWELSSEATRSLANDAKTLLANPALRIRVEGHADERGGTEYNLALSEKRAASIRAYLMDLGIARDRIETIAFGEERPLKHGHDEASWSVNRRGELTVTR